MEAVLEIYTLGGVRILRHGEPVSGLSTRHPKREKSRLKISNSTAVHVSGEHEVIS